MKNIRYSIFLFIVITSLPINSFSQSTEQDFGYSLPIQGLVYLDLNHNGIQDTDEPGLKNIGVSDGKDVVLTGKDGFYLLPNLDQSAKFVFVSIPSHYHKTNQFYYIFDTASSERKFNFGLQKTAKKDRKNFIFIQTTDIHISGPKDEQQFVDCIEEINTLSKDIAFVVATGDLVNTGDDIEQLETYVKGIQKSKYTWYNVFGNHDANDWRKLSQVDFTRNYRHHLGPDYYSFDYADYHLVMLNSVKVLDRQKEWLKNDLQLLGKRKKLIFFQHYAPKPSQVEELQSYNVKAIISGHWHSNKITDHAGLLNINSPTFRFGGIDVSPAGFRILEVKNNKLTSIHKIGGQEKRLAITYPNSNLEIHPDNLHISANVYDSSSFAKSVSYEINGDMNRPVKGWLSPKTEWTWSKKLSSRSLDLGQYQIHATVSNDKGEQWDKSAQFELTDNPIVLSQPTTDWVTFKGSPDRLGISSDSIKPPFRLNWSYPTEGSIDFASPIIDNSHLYISVKDRNGLKNNGILALNATTGEKIWFKKTDSEVNHSVTGFNGKIFAVTVGGKVYAFNAKNGNIEWTYILDGDGTERWIYAAPVIYNDNLYVGSGARFACLNPETGSVRWQRVYGSDWISSLTSPAISKDKIYMGAIWNEFSCFAMNASNGDIIWNYKNTGLHTSPVPSEDKVFVADINGKLSALSEDSGQQLWQFDLGKGWAVTVPTISDNLVIAGSSLGILHGVDKNTGESVWQFSSDSSLVRMSPYRDDYSSVFSSAIISGDLVYIGCSDGHLYALNKNTGEKVWSYDLGVPIVSTPAISGNTLYFGAYDGNIYSLTSQSK